MKIKELPITEHPRERMLQYGVENLSNTDLISIIIRSGTKENSVKDISNNLLNYVGSINNLSNIGLRELSNIKGVGIVKAEVILASIELGKRVISNEIKSMMKLNNQEIVHDTFKNLFIGSMQEKFLAIYLDTKKCLLSYKVLFVGTLNYSVVHPREIYKEALKVSASSIIVMHNHPSGNVIPSKEDIEITKKIKSCGDVMGIPLIDHIITNGSDYYSLFKEIN